MKKLAIVACTAAFALSACGSQSDASDDAEADTVEMPADEAMEGMPDPVDSIDVEEEMDANEEEAEAAADEAVATVDDVEDAIAAAEAETE